MFCNYDALSFTNHWATLVKDVYVGMPHLTLSPAWSKLHCNICAARTSGSRHSPTANKNYPRIENTHVLT